MLERKELRKKFKYLIFPVAAIVVLLTSSCSESGSTKQIRSTLFLLDASRSTISSVSARESQLRERLEGVFDTQEAIYFDFIRTDFTKQLIVPLISMQTIININDAILKDAKDEKVRKETKELVTSIWQQALVDSRSQVECDSASTNQLSSQTVLSDTGARSIARNICLSAAKAKEVFADIRDIGSGKSTEGLYIGSDVQGAFVRGLARLESESKNLINSKNEVVGVRATIVVSSDMMQRNSQGIRVIDEISGMSEEEIAEYVINSRAAQDFRTLRPNIIIDGWLSTKKNFSEPERILLETYWKTWFTTLDLDEPDFGFGVVDWSVTQ
jgi:hypothetical protein